MLGVTRAMQAIRDGLIFSLCNILEPLYILLSISALVGEQRARIVLMSIGFRSKDVSNTGLFFLKVIFFT